MVSEVFGAAKRSLKAGDILDGPGGSTVYALNDLREVTEAEGVVPLGLLPGAKLRRDEGTDQTTTYDMVDLNTTTTLYHLRALQDANSFGRSVAASKVPLAVEDAADIER